MQSDFSKQPDKPDHQTYQTHKQRLNRLNSSEGFKHSILSQNSDAASLTRPTLTEHKLKMKELNNHRQSMKETNFTSKLEKQPGEHNENQYWSARLPEESSVKS